MKAKGTATKEAALVYLSPDKLFTHPRNLRRFYPENHVAEMAASIANTGGVRQALHIVPKGTPGEYFVVDGNLRLTAAKYLGNKGCPPLKCEIVDHSEGEQLLTMLITAKFRYAPDPISESLHYKRLIEEEGYSVDQISQSTGIHAVTIKNRLRLLRLDKEIQHLIAEGKFPTDHRAAEALLAIENPSARIKLAERLSQHNAPINTIIQACTRLRERLLSTGRKKSPSQAAPQKMAAAAQGALAAKNRQPSWRQIRDNLRQTCHSCEIYEENMSTTTEPSWALLAHASERTCTTCDVGKIAEACRQCPAVDLIRNLASITKRRAAA